MAKYVDRLRHERHAKVSTPRGKPGSPFSHGFRFAQKYAHEIPSMATTTSSARKPNRIFGIRIGR
jgi:hypothetical protein